MGALLVATEKGNLVDDDGNLVEYGPPQTLLKACVFGGSGFVGKAVCKTLAAKGVAVTSVSRSGRPADAEPWMDKVDWVAADAAKAPASLPVSAPPLLSPLFGLLDPGISLIGRFLHGSGRNETRPP